MNTKQHLKRFLDAQDSDYETALAEIKSGRKRSHWMWYIFPQIAGLGSTATSRHYAIKDIQEATDFLFDETLGPRLVNICKALLELPTNDAFEIFGDPDHLKLRSSMTLFDAVPATFPVFGQVLDKFYRGERDQRTLDILKQQKI
ncbi:uncharacterized protein (DUF1810 family) [Mucilaginibacter sp. SG538B]|uniref:DUF1810 domain-containing protein n=1 Tax=Mucilaginibacter sp. SG538B TaxID=2587021 RepID=UPI00159DDFBE|nr:DUF1810 domain-containing protein [Mucilaginibacter sp. SG538B]NVM67747.1 uncharacterized protein (DUF1810 family) [Mucilaginibacter sp. SG538B]